jgi:RND family efflux transporter MFP subunit
MPHRGYSGVWLVLLLTAGGAAGCNRGGAPPKQAAPPPPAVTVTHPVLREITSFQFYNGRIEAIETVDIRARVRGFLQAIHFKEGTKVNKGDLLYEIDPRTFEADTLQAQAQVTRAKAQLAEATSEAERGKRLRAANAITEEEYQQRITTLDTARAALEEMQAALQKAQLELNFTKIYAPISGRISRTLVTVGNLVGSSEPTLLTTIVRMDPIYVYFDVPEINFLQYQQLIRTQGAPAATEAKVPVFVGLPSEQGYPHEGVINFRDSQVDPGTGTIVVRGELPNSDWLLIPGLFVRIRVPIGKPQERLLVPQVALQADQRGRYVLVVGPENTVEYRPVTPGQLEGDLIVIEKGLQPTDRVLVGGIQKARPGAKVTPQDAPAANAAQAPQPASSEVGTGASPPTSGAVPPTTASPPGSTRP